MTKERAISEIKLIQSMSLQGVQSIYFVDTVNDAIWLVLDRADGFMSEILSNVGMTLSDINKIINQKRTTNESETNRIRKRFGSINPANHKRLFSGNFGRRTKS